MVEEGEGGLLCHVCLKNCLVHAFRFRGGAGRGRFRPGRHLWGLMSQCCPRVMFEDVSMILMHWLQWSGPQYCKMITIYALRSWELVEEDEKIASW